MRKREIPYIITRYYQKTQLFSNDIYHYGISGKFLTLLQLLTKPLEI